MKITDFNEWKQNNGFAPDGTTYMITGDTYSIKNTLKELGFKFSPMLLWHCAESVFKLPEGYSYIKFNFSDLYVLNNNEYIIEKENAKQKVKEELNKLIPPSTSNFIGEVGDRLRHIKVKYLSCRLFENDYGISKIYRFDYQGNILIWFTSCNIEVEIGDEVDLSGTIKNHTEFRGEKNTRLTRCLIKPL